MKTRATGGQRGGRRQAMPDMETRIVFMDVNMNKHRENVKLFLRRTGVFL
jgi:hypothetical protein